MGYGTDASNDVMGESSKSKSLVEWTFLRPQQAVVMKFWNGRKTAEELGERSGFGVLAGDHSLKVGCL